MRPPRSTFAVAALCLAATPSAVKDSIGVYALIDRVVLEPDARNPERIQMWGVFAIANPITVENGELMKLEFGVFHPARRGYVYYHPNPLDPEGSRSEWAKLAAVAGSGNPVAYGGMFPVPGPGEPNANYSDPSWLRRVLTYNGRVRRAGEPVANPDAFPLRMAAPGRFGAPAFQVQRVPEPLSPADGGSAAPDARFVVRNVKDPTLLYVFEIEGPDGIVAKSEPIAPGDGQTTWSPLVPLKRGASYTWRVWAAAANGTQFPPAEATFRVDG
jgi:hypothetical protein